MKYKITISEGCTAFYTEINEKIRKNRKPNHEK